MSPRNGWKIYRTRFLVHARQLTEPLTFQDALGREHHGLAGDYLVETSDGMRRIAPRDIFEDIYVPLHPELQDRRCQKRPRAAASSSNVRQLTRRRSL